MIKILILEDNRELAKILLKALGAKDRKLIWHTSLKELYKTIKEQKIDLFVLDRLVDDGDSLESIEYLKELNQDSRFIFLTKQNKTLEKIVGLEKGADDYLSKPFSLAELRIKVRNMLTWKSSSSCEEEMCLGEVSFFPNTGYLVSPDKEIHLRKREAELVFYLFQAAGRVVSKQHLISKLWEPDQGVKVNTIDVYIKRLRKKLGNYQEIIKTRRGFGYQLVPYKRGE